MASMKGSIKEDIRKLMGINIPSEVIHETFDQLGELSDSLESYFDQILIKMKQSDENILPIS